MGDFGDNFDIDPAAEFLAREQDELAGLDDEVKNVITVVPPHIDDTTTNVFKENSESFEMINGIEQDFYDDSKEQDSEPAVNGFMETISPSPPRHEKKEEPEKIKKWREEQKTRLEEKDREEEIKKEELRQIAAKELQDWYKHHEEQIAKTKAANRESAKNAEKQFVAEDNEIEPGTEWERIAKLCDFNPKASKGNKDVSRMRSIILQLKQSPPPVTNKA
ncbi:clathrin light chain isoform X1 [Photinus pyralis]|uniref:clathrin light chain isoform X1 n=1 Tax=Photinus pyralis TaxID=7054 RepID=UPI0012671F87|nr:clathrin light chain isoform X1 [Photinus pyralis]